MLDIVRAITPRAWLPRTTEDISSLVEEAHEPVNIPGALEIGGKVIDCTIVELTARGACVCLDELEDAHGAFIGQQGLLRPHGGKPVSTVVRWFSPRSLSLKFLTPVSLDAFDGPINAGRTALLRPGRAEVRIPAQIICGARGSTATILNLSVGGALIRADCTFRPGEPIMLQCDMIRPIGGYVRWKKDNMLGMMFNRLLATDCAETVSQAFNVHPIWMEEIAECHRN